MPTAWQFSWSWKLASIILRSTPSRICCNVHYQVQILLISSLVTQWSSWLATQADPVEPYELNLLTAFSTPRYSYTSWWKVGLIRFRSSRVRSSSRKFLETHKWTHVPTISWAVLKGSPYKKEKEDIRQLKILTVWAKRLGMNRKKCEWRIVKTTRNHHTSGIEPRIKYDAEEKIQRL